MRRFWVVALVCSGLACGLPVTFTKIDHPEQPVTGVRFILRRPGTYKASMLFDLDQSRATCSCLFKPSIEQELDGEPITYEATSDTNFLTEDNIAFTIDEKDGALTAFTGGETDQLGPLLENLAAVATKVAETTMAVTLECEPEKFALRSCARPLKTGEDEAEFHTKYDAYNEYVEGHVDLGEALDKTRTTLAAKYADLSLAATPAALREIAALEKGVTGLQAKLDAHRLRLSNKQFQLKLDGRVIGGDKDAKMPWLVVVLEPRRRPQ